MSSLLQDSDESKDLLSDFLARAYILPALGLDYKPVIYDEDVKLFGPNHNWPARQLKSLIGGLSMKS